MGMRWQDRIAVTLGVRSGNPASRGPALPCMTSSNTLLVA